ncbi:MAG: transcriptional activator domain protein [Geminicoccaceae bacterium]|nr:transcriptional activator domain protein [Geminicoccaceae bacterium]
MQAILSIRLFGNFELRSGDTPLPGLGSARAESLLAYLILNGDAPQPRQHVAFRLWPDSSESQARTNLRHVLHDLRRALPDADRYLDVRPRTLQWKPALPVWLDVAEFDAAIRRAERAATESPAPLQAETQVAALREATTLYRGDLFEACYDEWLNGRRDAYRKRFFTSLDRLARLLEERREYSEALVHVERLLHHEPVREDAWRLLMRLRDARGDRAGALHAYYTCVATLERELGVPPTEETRSDYEALLRGGAERPRGETDAPRGEARHRTAAPRPHQAELSRLLPELLARSPDLVPPPPLPEDALRPRLFDAAAQALSLADGPLLLVIDDIQWSDHETSRLLHYLLRRAAPTPLLIAATARAEDVERQPLAELRLGLQALGLVTEVTLDRLSRAATADLAAALTSRPLDRVASDALFRETEGNPLFIVEAVRAGWQPGAHAVDALTPKVHAVIVSRLGQLSDAARSLVGVAATLGRDFTPDTLAQAGELATDAVARSLDELWRTRILRETNAGAYDFTHDKIREVAYLALSPPARRQNHLRAALALKRLRVRDLDAVSGQIAAHYDRAGVAEEALSWYEAAAETSQRLHASQEAARMLTRALELVRSLPRSPEHHSRELAILTAMLTPLASAHGFASSQVAEAQQAVMDLVRVLDVEPPSPVIRSLAISNLSRDEFEVARRYGEQLRARGEADGDDALLVEAEYVLGIAAFWQGELDAARRHFEKAVAGYRPNRRSSHLLRYWLDPQVVSLSRLGNTLWFLGDPVAAGKARDDALTLASDIGHEPTRRTALVFATILALDMGDTERVRRYAADLYAGLTDDDARPTRMSARTFRAYVRVLDGDVQPGIDEIRAALNELSEGGHAPGQRAVIARLLTAAHEAARDTRGRLAAAEQALASGGPRLWESEAHRARAESLAELGAARDDVLAAFECAIAVARRQGARMLEQRAIAVRDRYLGSPKVTSAAPGAPRTRVP